MQRTNYVPDFKFKMKWYHNLSFAISSSLAVVLSPLVFEEYVMCKDHPE